jgi:hypothetical protein
MTSLRSFLGAALVVALALGASTASAAGRPPTCPLAKPSPSPVASRPGTATVLVPSGADALLLCRYSGLNGPGRAGRLTRRRLVTTAPIVERLARELDAIAPTPPDAVFSCPADDGSEILAEFEYRAGAADPVTVDLTGCTTAINGHVIRRASAAIIKQLDLLVA